MTDILDEIKTEKGIHEYGALFAVSMGHTELTVAADDQEDATQRAWDFRERYFDRFNYEADDEPQITEQLSQRELEIAKMSGALPVRLMTFVERNPAEFQPIVNSWYTPEAQNTARAFLHFFGLKV